MSIVLETRFFLSCHLKTMINYLSCRDDYDVTSAIGVTSFGRQKRDKKNMTTSKAPFDMYVFMHLYEYKFTTM